MPPDLCVVPAPGTYPAEAALALVMELRDGGVTGLVRAYVATVGVGAEGERVRPAFPNERQARLFHELMQRRGGEAG
jgi:hypothetical protein